MSVNDFAIRRSTLIGVNACGKPSLGARPRTIRQENNNILRCKQIAADPSVCATHTIVVVDQSGSMKKCDVPGFRTRSNATYGTLALDCIAPQLHVGPGCGYDFVSVVEFNVTSIPVLQREPLDWLMFNALLDRQTILSM
jgi:hypothetical protein